MGVKTVAWGPNAWKFFHGLCKVVDLYIEGGGKYKDRAVKLTIQYFSSTNQRVPCIYCRRSLSVFATTGETDIRQVWTTPDKTFSRWAYLIHQKVNQKLNKKKGYAPKFNNVKYALPNNGSEWWKNLFYYACYVVCDYDMERALPIRSMFVQIAEILNLIGNPFGKCLSAAIRLAAVPTDFDTHIADRFIYIHEIDRQLGKGDRKSVV